MQLDDAAAILATAEFFEICDAEQRRLLAFASERVLFSEGDVVYASGEVPDGAHILVDGILESTPDDEKSPPVEISEPGAMLGAMAMIVAKPRPVTVVAKTEAETLFIPRSAFRKLVQQSPDLAARAAERISSGIGQYLGAIGPARQKMSRS